MIANSIGAEMAFRVGDVIERIVQRNVTLPSYARSAIEEMRQEKKQFALLSVSTPSGSTRFVT